MMSIPDFTDFKDTNNLNQVRHEVDSEHAQSKKSSFPISPTKNFQVAQLHLHWGAEDTEGSEHWLDGKQFSAECHLVTSYGTEGKYAVVNRFFKVVSKSVIKFNRS